MIGAQRRSSSVVPLWVLLTCLLADWCRAVNDFHPLDCNNDLARAPCQKWSNKFGAKGEFPDAVVIPCGECVVVDSRASSSILMPRGLNIIGRLVIPPGQKIVFETSYVHLQGEFIVRSIKPVDGDPDVVLRFIGKEPLVLNPHGNNAQNCGSDGCDAGVKPFFISGGKLNIMGMRYQSPTWVHLYDTTVDDSIPDLRPHESTGIVVSDVIVGRWAVGAQVLITSHTFLFRDQQIRTITSVDDYRVGYVALGLDKPIARPMTLKDSPDFAVEVALLSRNILFTSPEEDGIESGGHVIVFHTPEVRQWLEGVEISNFGQQGHLGRYPIHFHLCGNVTGSKVLRNSVRHSNQRCIVAHGSNNLRIQGNIAYDTFGHCFMTEDGIETGNIFKSNLGALTKIPEKIIPVVQEANNGEETDGLAATFWITNPDNLLEGNIAAGSESSGIWFEFRDRVRGVMATAYEGQISPRNDPMRSMTNNVAHSNLIGFRWYPHGYLPDTTTSYDRNHSFRNRVTGMFLHRCRNMNFTNSIFADNRKSVDFDDADDTALIDSKVIGTSQSILDIVASHPREGRLCRDVFGIEIHSAKDFRESDGVATLENVSFSGFDTACSTGESVAMHVQPKVNIDRFDGFSKLKGLTLENKSSGFSLCEASEAGYSDIFITDIDSSLNPEGDRFMGFSSIISQSDFMRAFVDSSKCTDVSRHCYDYCRDTCFVSILVTFDPTDRTDPYLRVCNSLDLSECLDVYKSKGNYNTDEYNEFVDSGLRSRIYLNLPVNKDYRAVFLSSDGQETWPSFVDVEFESHSCATSLDSGEFQISGPELVGGECKDLIRNGSGEEGTNYWLRAISDSDNGVDGSMALLIESRRQDGSIGQFLDSRCLKAMEGQSYQVRALVKVSNPQTGATRQCRPDVRSCPTMGYVITTKTGSSRRVPVVGRVSVNGPLVNGFQVIQGVFTVDSEMANARSVEMFLTRNWDGFSLYVDDVSVSSLDNDDGDQCSKGIVKDGSLTEGSDIYWEKRGPGNVFVSYPGYGGAQDAALQMDNAIAETVLKSGCIEIGQRYAVSAKYRVAHNPEPTDYLRLYLNSGSGGNQIVAVDTLRVYGGGWKQVYGQFIAEPHHQTEGLVLGISRSPVRTTMLIDDVLITEIPKDCNELIANSDFELGPLPFWRGVGSSIQITTNGIGHALLSTNRAGPGAGPRFKGREYMDLSCLASASRFRIAAKVKLVRPGTRNDPVSCDLGSNDPATACPRLRIYEASNGVTAVTRTERSYTRTRWINNGFFNDYAYEFEPQLQDHSDFYVYWADFVPDADLVIDNFSMVPVN